MIEPEHKYVNYYDANIQCDECYLYKLAAVDVAGNVSYYSDVVSATALPDDEKPVIMGIAPKANSVIGENTSIQVTARDNSGLAKLNVQLKDNETGIWKNIYTKELSDRSTLEKFTLDLTDMATGDYSIRLNATDEAGNVGDYYVATYSLDNQAPKLDYKTTTGDFCVDIGLVGVLPEDYDYFQVYRRKKSAISQDYYEFQKIATVRNSKTYKDETVEPWYDYEYKLHIYDQCGNYYETPISVCHATDNDTMAPVLNVTGNVRTIEGLEICVDAGESYDNVRIENIIWEISDGTVKTGRKLKHVFDEEGEYQIKVTAVDGAGNQTKADVNVKVLPKAGNGIIHIKVVDEVGHALPYAYVYMNDTNDSSVCYRTDGHGMLTFTSKVGDYKVAAYKANYIPKDIGVSVSEYQENTYQITLPKGEIIVGSLTVEKMTLEEMEYAGVDFSDPSNCNVFNIDIELGFAEKPITNNVVTVTTSLQSNTGGGIGINSIPITNENGGGTGADSPELPPGSGIGSSGGSSYISICKSEDTEVEEPLLVYLNTSQTVSWLKDMYSVNLQVLNTADYQRHHDKSQNLP